MQIAVDGVMAVRGFVTTRAMTADTVGAAVERAVASVESELRSTVGSIPDAGVEVVKAEEVDKGTMRSTPSSGFTWYREEQQ